MESGIETCSNILATLASASRVAIDIFWPKAVGSADPVGVAQFATVDGCYDVSLGYHDSLPGHRGRLIGCGASLHDFLQVRRQVHQGTPRRQLSLVRVYLKLGLLAEAAPRTALCEAGVFGDLAGAGRVSGGCVLWAAHATRIGGVGHPTAAVIVC